MKNIGLHMIRESLADLPDFLLPKGYFLRRYVPGDERIWVAVYRAAEPFIDITPELFQREFHNDVSALRDRMYFLCHSHGKPVGTITAWPDELNNRPDRGRVHWVAIVPEFQGRGLGKPLMSIALRRLRELGHAGAFLSTSSARIPAVNLYLRFGFVPEIGSEEQLAAWRAITPQIRAEVQSVMRAACAGSRDRFLNLC